MSWLLALVAFAGVMALLSTLVTVAVEAIHKLFAMRRSGLQEMMRAMHDNVVHDWAPGKPVGQGDGRSKEAIAFARAMTRNPAFGGGGRWWWPRNWPLVRNILFQPNLERLNLLQFFEQLGQTDAGRAIAAKPTQDVRQFVQRASQEFERYGEMQSDYFGRRAKAISALAALVFVAVGNINAVPIFKSLAAQQDPIATATRLQAAQSNFAPIAPGQTPSQYVSQIEALSLEGLPIGGGYFPYCDGSVQAQGCADAQPMVYNFAGLASADLGFLQRLWSLDGLVWVLSIIATAGLLGLGAPFWFQLFRTLGSSATGARAAQALSPPARAPAAVAVSRPTQPTLDDLTHALLRTAGKAPPAEPGMAAPFAPNNSAASSASSSASSTAAGVDAGMRRVRR